MSSVRVILRLMFVLVGVDAEVDSLANVAEKMVIGVQLYTTTKVKQTRRNVVTEFVYDAEGVDRSTIHTY